MGIFSKNKDEANQNSLGNMALNCIRDAVLIVDPRGSIQLANPAAESLLEVPKTEMLGLNYASVVRLVDKSGAALSEEQNPIAVLLRTNQYIETKDLSIVKIKTGERIPIWLIATPGDNNSGDKIITIRNIAKELEEESERGEFISTASHEMRTPVASIEGYLGLALSPQTATIDDRARTYLTKAHEASQHLGKLFRDLLDSTKLDDGKMKTHPMPVELGSVVRNIAEGMAPNVASKGLNFVIDDSIKEDGNSAVKKLKQIFYCSVDIDFLREVIDNLIENSIKYTPTGSITVSMQGDQQSAVVVVSDTGIGISGEDQKHIFQKFYRVDNSQTRTIGGTGLGLYITKQRVETMGGRIWVESELGKGTKFFVSFPRLTSMEYEKQKLAASSIMAQQQTMQTSLAPPPLLQDAGAPAPIIAQAVAQPIPMAPQPVATPPPAPVAPPPPAVPENAISSGQAKHASDLDEARLAEVKRKFAESMRAAAGG